MKKEYERPIVEMISLVSVEKITNNDEEIMDGEMGLESSIF